MEYSCDESRKHVLCEKPMASNVAEANVWRVADEEGFNEVFHWRYHPLAKRVELLRAKR